MTDELVMLAALYQDGAQVASPTTLSQVVQARRDWPQALTWLSLDRPNPAQIEQVAEQFHFHPLVREDIIEAHQRPKVERYADCLFVVLHTAAYVEPDEAVELAEIHLIGRPGLIVSIRQGDSTDLDLVRRRLESEPALLGLGLGAILYAIVDAQVDRYLPVSDSLRCAIDALEDIVFAGHQADPRRVYAISSQQAAFSRLLRSTEEVINDLNTDFGQNWSSTPLRDYWRDVADHLTRLLERSEAAQTSLRDILSVNASLASNQQNDQMKKVSAWAAILFTPSLITGIYGMNFSHMPELHWALGYPAALLLMVGSAIVLYIVFKRKGWV
ncbi:MAG: magnesium/cobalt transporter CorA [Propionibacteriaceae bacterium]|jgi:magnesium transporter|nr:magnesium/cobalt transporter CorA [Propionibacteriaceae bacterium]